MLSANCYLRNISPSPIDSPLRCALHCVNVLHMANRTPQPAQDLIGTAEICRLLQCNPATVGRWVASGKLTPAHKLPGKNGAFLFTRADIEKFAADRAEASV